MRILIQDSAGKSFYSGEAWDENESHAMDFENVAQAEEFCHEHNLTRALIVVKFKNAANDVSYPVGGANMPQLLKSFTKRREGA